MKRVATTLLGATLLMGACQDGGLTSVDSVQPEFARTGPASSAMYEVTVTNLTNGQPLTPPLAVTHRRPLGLFTVGEAASMGLREVAENGNLGPLMEALSAETHVSDLVVALGDPPPILPGEARTFEISTDRGAKYLSFVSMLICTNDGFSGVDALRLPSDPGESAMVYGDAYDAGSEINTEDFADLVPPCPALTGVTSTDPGSGTSNPMLAEDGVVAPHPGIEGTADLMPGLHGWTDPVISVTVTRIG